MKKKDLTKFIPLVIIGFLIFSGVDCKKNPVGPTEADTTSHAWTFAITMLGGAAGSALYDVSIVNDTDVWAVGAVYIDSADGAVDPFPYNVTTWNGGNWNINRIPYIYDGTPTYSPITWTYVIDANDIWFGNSTHWDGKQFQDIDIGTSVFYGVGTTRMWGSEDDLYVVGNQGTIAQNTGTGWQKMQSGTSLNLQDIYGSGGTLLAIASYPGESLDKTILQINGSTVTQLSTNGIPWPLSSVWFVPGHYYVVGQGIYEKTSLSDPVWRQDSVDTVDFFSCIRGNAWNDFFVAGGYGQLLHFNGKSWQSYQDVLGLQNGAIARIAVKGNLMIAVGQLGSKAVAIVGKRQSQ